MAMMIIPTARMTRKNENDEEEEDEDEDEEKKGQPPVVREPEPDE
jgi:hypothetical protein